MTRTHEWTIEYRLTDKANEKLIDKETYVVKTLSVDSELNDSLMTDVLQVTGLKTKKEAVELGLKTLIRLKKQEEIKKFKGKLKWDDDLDRMRTD